MIEFQQIADLVKGGVTESTEAATTVRFLETCSSVGSDLGVVWLVDSGLSNAQAANVIRGEVLARINRGVEVSAIGAASGYLLPTSPIPRINEINRGRRIFVKVGTTESEGLALVEAVRDLVLIADGYDAGRITFDRSQPSAQLASFEVSVDGMAPQSGDALTDILGYQPDADYVKRKRALDSLGRLDFSKRRPYLLFTADIITDGRRQNGTIVCWARMRDASGYNITKRDVFNAIDLPVANLSNASLAASTTDLDATEHFRQVLSFYDWVHPGDYVAFVDDSTVDDTLYSYKVTGVQRRAPASPFLFDVPTSALYLSAAQIEQVGALIQQELSSFDSELSLDSVSPYPAIAQVVYGDPGYGWILAGVNVTSSRRRGDSADETRRLTYIGARASHVLAQVSAGRMFVPNDVGSIHSGIDGAVASFGISQTLLSVLDGIGVTLFAAGKDDPLGVQPTEASLQGATGGLAKILSAIDPSTATVDPRVLASALTVRSAGPSDGPRYTFATVQTSGPTMPPLESFLGTEIIDLTTYLGISSLMQILRTVYDFYPRALT